jgi:hypothetical protein
MAPDPHQGGRLEDMAAEGTTIPGDAGKQNLVSCTIVIRRFGTIRILSRMQRTRALVSRGSH